MIKSITTFTLIFVCISLQAQNFLSWKFIDRYFSLYIGTGTATYLGELNYPNHVNLRPSQLNMGVESRLLSRLGVRIQGTYLTLSGNDNNAPDSSFQKQRNLSFDARNFEAQINLVYYFKPYYANYHTRWKTDFYLTSGIGYMFYDPRTQIGNDVFKLRKYKTEGIAYKKWTFTLPVGIGAKFKINEFININAEVTYHFTFTDYIDDVSNTYATEFVNTTAELLSDRKDETTLISLPLYDQIVPGAKRGDPTKNDAFALFSLKFEIYIPPDLFSKNVPIIRKPTHKVKRQRKN